MNPFFISSSSHLQQSLKEYKEAFEKEKLSSCYVKKPVYAAEQAQKKLSSLEPRYPMSTSNLSSDVKQAF
jgi:hypothetical protein